MVPAVPERNALARQTSVALLGKDRFRVVALSVDSIGFPQLQAFYDVVGVKSLNLYRGDESEVLTSLRIVASPRLCFSILMDWK